MTGENKRNKETCMRDNKPENSSILHKGTINHRDKQA